MIDKLFEVRVLRWAHSCREHKRVQRCATEIFCESLPYLYGVPEPMLDEDGNEIAQTVKSPRPSRQQIECSEEEVFNRAFRDKRLSGLMRDIIRFRYCYGMTPFRVEKKCHLAKGSFQNNLEITMMVFHRCVKHQESLLERGLMK